MEGRERERSGEEKENQSRVLAHALQVLVLHAGRAHRQLLHVVLRLPGFGLPLVAIRLNTKVARQAKQDKAVSAFDPKCYSC